MKITGINHLAFITHDMEKTIRYYRDLLGMTLEAGVGHDGFRHYFFRAGNTQIAFFEYDGASPMARKDHGVMTSLPLGFDHLSFQVESREDLFALKGQLEGAGFEVSPAVDHGTIWSIYFFDPNNIQLEASWTLVEIVRPPAMAETDPMPIVAEGAAPQPGHWPAPTTRTPEAAMVAHAGNGHPMRQGLLEEGRGNLTADAAAVLGRVRAAE